MINLNPNPQTQPIAKNIDKVSYLIKVNNQAAPDTLMVKSIDVTRCANRIPFATLIILDGEIATQSFPASDLDLLSPGNAVEIQAGYHGANSVIFKGIILRHSILFLEDEASHIEIFCKDNAVKLSAGRKNKYFFNQTDSSVIEDILRPYGAFDVDQTRLKHREMVQFYSTDWDFVVSRAEANGMLVLADDGKVSVKQPNFNQNPKFTLSLGPSVYEFEAGMDARDQFPTVEVSTWDPAAQQALKTTPGGSPAPAQASASAGAGGATPNTDYTAALGLANYPLQHSGVFKPEEADAWAQAQMLKSELAKKRGRIKFDGTADIKPGDCIELQGFGQRHSGKVLVTAVTQEIGEGAWFTHAQFGLPLQWLAQTFDDVSALPAAGLVPAVHGLQVGVVTRLQGSPADPDFRIQVRLPLLAPQGEGVWSRLAAQDAGNKRGAIWRPEIGDEVIVGFFNDDPRHPVVLGAMHSSAHAAPIAAADKNHEKGWITRSDMRLIFNDDEKSIVISTPKGKKITLDEKNDKIQLEDEHRNTIRLDQNGILIESGKDIILKASNDFKLEAINVGQKAAAAFKAEAQGQATLQSTAEVVVKGTFVRIN